MTRDRMFGSDTEFCAWMRACKDLPSASADFGFSACDNDVTVHRYKTSVDTKGTRQIQGLMMVEIKTRRGLPPSSQMDTLSKLNLFKGQKHVSGQTIRFFGVFVLVMNGTDPENSEKMWWGSIKTMKVTSDAKELKWKRITKETLISILRFDVDPYSFAKNPFRRHHKRSEIIVTKMSPLGFEFDECIVKES